MNRLVSLLLVFALVLLVGCGHSRVVKREPGARPASPAGAPAQPRGVAGGYTVQRGDTLYGIAFRHGLDFRDVAAWNRITAPYTIYPGQRLRLQPSGGDGVARVPSPAPPASAPSPGSVTGMPAPRPSGTGFVDVPRTGSAPATPPPASGAVTAAPPATPPPARPAAPTVSPPATVPAPAPGPVVAGAVSAAGWSWPTDGQLIGRFVAGDPKRQGLDIAGVAGQPVRAAADGVVVYSGAGLVGYGELIIVKHSDDWLSAYAHNRARLVGEGTAVKRGQQIAELGRTGTSRDMLHFEVRRAGRPVDPLTVLPARP